MKKFNWHYDDAHGWLEVDLQFLQTIGILNKISCYSYYSEVSGKAYLEEDCDAGILFKAMGDSWNNDGAREIENNKIRNMKSF